MNLRQHLERYSTDSVRLLARNAGIPLSSGNKFEIIERLANHLLAPTELRERWDKLKDVERRAVAQALYNDGEFNPEAFEAQYQELPVRKSGPYEYEQRLSVPLEVFLFANRLPDDMMALLQTWVPKPGPFRLSGAKEAPADETVHGKRMHLARADTEHTGQADLMAFLSLVERDEMALASAATLPTPTAGKRLLNALATGDFWPPAEKAKISDTIRPVGLTIFAIHGGLVEHDRRGNLELSANGHEWLFSQRPELLLEAFERWEHATGGDEIARIGGLRNRRSRLTMLTPPSMRRERIVEALSWCPVGAWIDVEDFFRAIKAWQLDFEVEATPIKRMHVGTSAWDAYFDYWRAVNGLYILAVLWESLATIGALDILYLHPDDADYGADLGGDGDEPLSLYDGLRFFRINALGAYLFGQEGSYTSATAERPCFLQAQDGTIHVVAAEHITPADRLQLATFATPVDASTYQLDLNSLLAALEAKQDVATFRGYLARWLVGGVPAEMEKVFLTAAERAAAFAPAEDAYMIKARDRELAATVAQDERLRSFCRLAGDRTLVVPRSRLAAFRKRLREIGYVLPD